jgi:hypothetical protein
VANLVEHATKQSAAESPVSAEKVPSSTAQTSL